ncbi:hypothetical protein ILUMI_00324 [Ignelater luminosus]|uniref:Uncharacterized protein n=1 Tax=Ignelater luminosus TaxID=2038154 RepID=A0A8K0DLV0_IGNLU|nr:hypothetical protein ILUMI_00324 [Ignelater luminosus]
MLTASALAGGSSAASSVFKATKAVVDSSTIEIFKGIGLIRTEGNEKESTEQELTEKSVENAVDVESRQKALETYLITTGERFWNERTVTWNPAQTAKALVNTIPDVVTSHLTSFVSQGREKKNQTQMLIPFLVALKLKLAALSAIALMVIALTAKKAILAAVISLMLSGISGLKSIVNSKPTVVHPAELMSYQAPSIDWDPYMYGDGRFSDYVENASLISRSEPAPKTQLLIGHKAS